MQAGKLRHRVTIQTVTQSKDASGGATATFTDGDVIWAAVEPLSSAELLRAEMIESELTTLIRVRYSSKTRSLTSKDRFKWVDPGDGGSTHTFDILGPPIDEEYKHEELVFRCKEVT